MLAVELLPDCESEGPGRAMGHKVEWGISGGCGMGDDWQELIGVPQQVVMEMGRA